MAFKKDRDERLAATQKMEDPAQAISEHNADMKPVTEEETAAVMQPTSEAPDTYSALSREQMTARMEEMQRVIDSQNRTITGEDSDKVMRFGVEVKEGTVLRDPFSTQNPHQIRSHPPGLRLQWCNPKLRERSGWKGWEPVTYDSEIGQNLAKYITDPPARMEGVAGLDNYVRRGATSMLCWLKEEIWLHRQIATESISAQRVNAQMKQRDEVRRDGSVVISGGGVAKQSRPEDGFRFKHEGNPSAGDFLGDGAEMSDDDAKAAAANRALHN